MKRMIVAVGCGVLMLGAGMASTAVAAAGAETWTNVSIVDTMCATKVKANPDKHTRACALQCSTGGYGIIAADGTFLTLDDAGNAKVVAALKASKKADHLRATVSGERSGDQIKVATIELQK